MLIDLSETPARGFAKIDRARWIVDDEEFDRAWPGSVSMSCINSSRDLTGDRERWLHAETYSRVLAQYIR